MDAEGREHLGSLDTIFWQMQEEIEDFDTDAAYDEGYRDGKNEADSRTEFIAELLAFTGGAQTEEQPHGFITFNGNFFGFGDTPAESMVDFLKKSAEGFASL
jgi:hypothetical protein